MCGLCSFSTLFVTGESAADEKGNPNALLRGEYKFTLRNECIDSSAPFVGSDLRVPSGATVSTSFAPMFGNAQYNGDGTGTLTSASNTLRTTPGARAVSQSSPTCSLVYDLDADGSGSQLLIDCKGPGTGVPVVNGIVHQLQLSKDKKTIAMGTAEPPTMETITINGTPVSYRVCARIGVAIKVEGGNGDGD